ncbi:Exosome complex component RRP46 [Oopsacas minuta]|uniref:Exosome complex component RRP46 n=1 Tax=Oopsacas minuta TaxID=111878 RepID=A0AAV7JTA3_9METZ|nr:Exosome complex component RRP46 [Oopsacas minuta]
MIREELKEVDLGLLSKSDGSSRLYFRSSLVTVSVQGPAESRQQIDLANEAILSVHFCPRKVQPSSPTENVCVASIKKILESVIARSLFPRAIICIAIHEGVAGSCFLSTIFNACFLALLDAGIAMLHSFVALTIAIPNEISSNKDPIISPNKEQEFEAESVFVFVIEMPTKRELFCHAWGNFSPQHYQQCLQLALGEADKILLFYRGEYSKKLANLKFN